VRRSVGRASQVATASRAVRNGMYSTRSRMLVRFCLDRALVGCGDLLGPLTAGNGAGEASVSCRVLSARQPVAALC